MATRAPKRYVQSFTTGLSQLLTNSIGAYGPTLAITHFLPVYIPSLHNADFGGDFSDLFDADTDIGVTGIKGEPIWLPSDTVRYEYKATNFNKFQSMVTVANAPVSGSVSSVDTSACWENTIVKNGTSSYTLSQVSGGIVGTLGWNYQNDSSFYDYDTKLTMENLFPIKDYESPTGSDNTVCGRYIVGFKDIGTKLGLTTTDAKLQNIVNSKFVYNAVVLYGFKVLSVGPTEDGQVQYGLSTEAIPVAIAGIEGQPITLNMNKMDSQGNEWDSVWNIDIDFIPFSVEGANQINNITHRIVSEWSYWTKNQPDSLHTNNKIHVGMTVEPYGNSDQTNKTSAWVHISNKVIDPENFNVGEDEDYTRVAMDRRHIRMDADKTLVTLEMKDIGDSKGVLDLNYYGVDTNQSGANPSLEDTNPMLQAKGGKAFGSNDIAIGSGVTHDNTENSVSLGKDIVIDGNGYKNTLTIGENVTLSDNLMHTPNRNVVSVGDSLRNRGSNLVKVGESSVHNDVAGEERNIVMVGDNQDSYIGLRTSLLVGSNNDFSAKYGDAEYTDGKSMLVLGEGNQLSTGDYYGSTVTSATSGVFSWSVKLNGGAVSAVSGVSGLYNLREGYRPTIVDKVELIGDKNRIHGQGANLVNWKVKGDSNTIVLSGGTSDMFEVVGNENTLMTNQITKIKINGFRNNVANVQASVNIDGNYNSVRGSNITIVGDYNTLFGIGSHVRLFGENVTVGKEIPIYSSLTSELARYGRNIFGNLYASDIGGGYDSAMFGTIITSRENITSVVVGYDATMNSIKSSLASLTKSKFDNAANCILTGTDITSYGVSSFEGKVYLGNTLVVGNKISISDTANSKFYKGLKYASTNVIAVGDTFDLKNVENGLYVGSNIRSYGKQGFALGRNIFLHTVSDYPVGHIGAIGTNINFGADSSNLASVGASIDNVGNTTTIVIGDDIANSDINGYYNVIQRGTLGFVSMPSLIMGNNAYGNNTFASSWDTMMVRVGKWAQGLELGGEVLEGLQGWKFPYASFNSLSNATEFKVDLPVLNHAKVFGSSHFHHIDNKVYYVYSGNAMPEMENNMFVDEFGFVRMATSMNSNGKRDMLNVWDTLLYDKFYDPSLELATVSDYNKYKSAINRIITFFTDIDSTKVDHAHKAYYPTVFNWVNADIASTNSGIKSAITSLNYLVRDHYYGATSGSNTGVATLSTHVMDIHRTNDTDAFIFSNLPSSVSDATYTKVVTTIRALWYYMNKNVILVGMQHIHAPCIIEKLA